MKSRRICTCRSCGCFRTIFRRHPETCTGKDDYHHFLRKVSPLRCLILSSSEDLCSSESRSRRFCRCLSGRRAFRPVWNPDDCGGMSVEAVQAVWRTKPDISVFFLVYGIDCGCQSFFLRNTCVNVVLSCRCCRKEQNQKRYDRNSFIHGCQ